ncbi:efflux RND transporter periplasmic adaptor subunit [Pelagicoccus albus]|uniref:Efflux RND transporter periplasmic adaptor subunit n=1 Tax=Pelagicoccus albus TaxID=415222 RepID=A0A7X1BAC0_9BACT|nr:efflux RND transporter periplasmic adaptor subunit [Pelagicoccus albus]MBC2607260.1 efflux RND transporter periplasmic adaptor subunit [Pelagicoccus albus]
MKRNKRKGSARIWIITLAAVLAAGAAFIWLNSSGASPDKQATGIKPQVATIEKLVTAQGTLEPKDYVDVGAQISGQLTHLYIDIGDRVEKGQLIAEIDGELYETQVAANRANLKVLQAERDELNAELKQTEAIVERNRTLIKRRAVSQEELEETETSLAVAKARIQSLEAQIEQAESTLEGNLTNLSYTKIYAPMTGTVVDKSVREGETLNANQTTPTIVQIADLDLMTVRAEVAEADVPLLSPNQPVYFTTLGSQGRRWQAEVRQILPTPEITNDVVLYHVLVDVDNTDGSLMTGMTTQMFFVLGKAENVETIPVTLLTNRTPQQDDERGTAYQVTVLGSAGPEPRTIYVGLSDRRNAELRDGLKAGESILSSGPSGPVASNQTQRQGPPPRL